MGTLAPYLVGAATALAVQFWVVPIVERRRRREDRWERNVLELGELLTTSVRRSADEARTAQSLVAFVRQLEATVDADPERLARMRGDENLKASNATAAFNDVVQIVSPHNCRSSRGGRSASATAAAKITKCRWSTKP